MMSPNEMMATHVYLFRRNDGLIKIGVAKNIKKRLSNFRDASPDELSILRFIRVGKGMAFAIESGFKKLMHPCNKRGEWFKCSDILAIVALHVVEHGDLVGYAAVRTELAAPDAVGRNVFTDYAWTLYRSFPDHFKFANYWNLTTLDPDFRVIIKPKTWRKTCSLAASPIPSPRILQNDDL